MVAPPAREVRTTSHRSGASTIAVLVITHHRAIPTPDRCGADTPWGRGRPNADNGGSLLTRFEIAVRDAATVWTGKRLIRRCSSASKLIPRPANCAVDADNASDRRTQATLRGSNRSTPRAVTVLPFREGSVRRASSDTCSCGDPSAVLGAVARGVVCGGSVS